MPYMAKIEYMNKTFTSAAQDTREGAARQILKSFPMVPEAVTEKAMMSSAVRGLWIMGGHEPVVIRRVDLKGIDKFLARAPIDHQLEFGEEHDTREGAARSLFNRFPGLARCCVGRIYTKSPDESRKIVELTTIKRDDLSTVTTVNDIVVNRLSDLESQIGTTAKTLADIHDAFNDAIEMLTEDLTAKIEAALLRALVKVEEQAGDMEQKHPDKLARVAMFRAGAALMREYARLEMRSKP